MTVWLLKDINISQDIIHEYHTGIGGVNAFDNYVYT